MFNAKPVHVTESTKCYKLVRRTPDGGYCSYIIGTRIPDAAMNGREPFIAEGRKDVNCYREVHGGFIHSYAESSLAYVLDKILRCDMLEKGIELWECRIEPMEDKFGKFYHCYVSEEKFPEYASDRLWFVRPIARTRDDLGPLMIGCGIIKKRRSFFGGLKETVFRYIRNAIKKFNL